MDGDKLMYLLKLWYMFMTFVSFKRLHTLKFTPDRGFFDPNVVKAEAGDLLIIVNMFSWFERIFGGNKRFIVDLCVVLGKAPFSLADRIDVECICGSLTYYTDDKSKRMDLNTLMVNCKKRGYKVYLIKSKQQINWNKMTKYLKRILMQESQLTHTGKIFKMLIGTLGLKGYHTYQLLPEPKTFMSLLDIVFVNFNPSTKSVEFTNKAYQQLRASGVSDRVMNGFKCFVYTEYNVKVN